MRTSKEFAADGSKERESAEFVKLGNSLSNIIFTNIIFNAIFREKSEKKVKIKMNLILNVKNLGLNLKAL